LDATWSTAVIEKSEQVDLGRAQVDGRGLQIGLVPQALQFQAIEIDAGNIAGIEAVAADFQNVVVVLQIILRELQDGFGLQDADEGGADIEEQCALSIGGLGSADRGTFFCSLVTQIASHSTRIAQRSSVAEMTGNKTTSMHPTTSRNCKAEDARVCGRSRPSHSQ
jgi:hypothetical protein